MKTRNASIARGTRAVSAQRLSLIALLLLLAAPVFAQRFTAAIRGNVTDPSGAAINAFHGSANHFASMVR